MMQPYITPIHQVDRRGTHPCSQIGSDDNLIIKGDNLHILQNLLPRMAGRVKFVYADPPYNTHQTSFAYPDYFQREAYLSMMRERLTLAVQLLCDDGALVVQCDDHEQAYLKVMMDGIDGLEFLNCIAVKMSEATGVKMQHAHRRFPKLKEYLLVYVKPAFKGLVEIDKYETGQWDAENDIFLEGMTPALRQQLTDLQNQDPCREEDALLATQLLKDIRLVPLNKVLRQQRFASAQARQEWLYYHSYCIVKTAGSDSLTKVVKGLAHRPQQQQVAAALSKRNILFFYLCHFNESARSPRLRIIFADENLYKHPCDFWQDIKTTGAVAREGGVCLPCGKKPERLLYRLIKAFTHPGDGVLDLFAGSGTTCAVAHKMQRRYIGCEQMETQVQLIQTRLYNVIHGDQTGISPLATWQGGGAYTYCEIATANQ